MAPILNILRKNPFIFALFAAVVLAFLLPGLGAPDGPLKAGVTTKAGVMLIFLLQGLSLETRELARGLRDMRIHLFIQVWIFVLAAGILFGTAMLMRLMSAEALASGFLYLALVPTTVASAITFTGAAEGNVPAAIFNTTFSNILAVFWVPAGCLLLFSAGSGMPAGVIGPLLWKLTWLIIIPLAVGQVVRPLLCRKAWFTRISPRFKSVNHAIILFIVFTTFAQSVVNDTWSTVAGGSIALLILMTLLAMLVIHAGVWTSSRWILKEGRDRRTALFCGSQKTLAAGAPMAVAIFSSDGSLAAHNVSLILLPLLVYHPMQLFLAALLLPLMENHPAAGKRI